MIYHAEGRTEEEYDRPQECNQPRRAQRCLRWKQRRPVYPVFYAHDGVPERAVFAYLALLVHIHACRIQDGSRLNVPDKTLSLLARRGWERPPLSARERDEVRIEPPGRLLSGVLSSRRAGDLLDVQDTGVHLA